MIRKHKLLRAGLGSLMLAFLLSCGGGSEVGGGSVSGSFTGDGITLGGSSGGDNSTGGDGTSAGTSGGSAGTGGGDGSTSTAGNGTDDGSGVGSGGTGVSSANAGTSVGSVDGMGSIIVDGVRYNVDGVDRNDPTVFDLRDAADWKLGMTALVTGPVDADFATGTALKLKSMAQMRGVVDAVDTGALVPSFQLLGSTVTVDDETVWADLAGLAALSAGTRVQVWALPVEPGVLRATRVETQSIAASTTTLVTGMISGLDAANGTFQLNSLTVDYRLSALPADGLANGRIVRVEAAQPPVGVLLQASQVEGWYALSAVKDAPVQLEGVITNYASKGSFKLMGVSIDASRVNPVTGGPEDRLGNGVKVVASGKLSSDGVLVASKLKIRHIPGGGALPAFDLHGIIGNYVSRSDMMVRGQKVNASAATITNGTEQQLANGQKVWVQGTQVIEGVLQATQLTFE